MLKKFAVLLACLLCAAQVAFAAAAEAAPDRLVRDNTDKIISLIKANRDAYQRDNKKLYTMVEDVVLPHFDFRKMSQLVLARSWREATEEQRARFTGEFRELLVRAYSTVLLKYNDEKIVYLPFAAAMPDERTATVKVEVRRSAGANPVAIHYDFYRTEAGWKVYDVTVDGVSLVTSYRTTYAEKVRNEGIEALIASLASSNRSGAPVEPATRAPAGGSKR